jgi:ribonuclease HI
VSHDFAVFFDGGCTSNPGRLVVAAVVCTPGGEIVVESSRDAGDGTSNQAEYRALAYAVCLANLVGARQPLLVSDSMLVVQQINGWWAMRGDPGSPLAREHSRCSSALMMFDRWSLKHVPREKNKRADWLVSKHLGHDRTLKSAPSVAIVEHDGDGKPGWSELEPSRRRTSDSGRSS